MFKQPITHFVLWLATMLCIGAAAQPMSDTKNYGVTIATTEEIVDYFRPEPAQPSMRRRGGVRLLAPEQSTPQRRAISLEVNFAYDSDQLSELSIEQLKPVGEALVSESLQTLSFSLAGHTDAKGGDAYNLDLSERRAATVKRFFVERFGLSNSRISAIGRGERDLLNKDEPHSGVNRRVTVSAYY